MTTELLTEFIEKQELHVRDPHQPSFWAMKHFLITKALAAKHVKPLTEAQRASLYFLLMKFASVRDAIKAVLKGDEAVFALARDRHLAEAAQNTYRMTSPLELLFVVGHHRLGVLAGAENETLAQWKSWLDLLVIRKKVHHIPAIVDRVGDLAALGEPHARRALQALELLQFMHDRRGPDSAPATSHYDYTNLTFWCVVGTALTLPEQRQRVVDGLMAETMPERAQHLRQLRRFLIAIDPDGQNATIASISAQIPPEDD